MKKITVTPILILITAIVYWSFFDMQPSVKKSATNSSTEFSMSNALYHLKSISKKPHYVGTPEHKVVQNYIVNELKKLGLTPEIQIQTAVNKKWRAATTTENIIARIKGTEQGKALLLLTHYDSNPHSSLGASDAGSGVVVILEGIRAFLAQNKTPKNDIIILISDAEELGLLGAKAFVENHPWAKDVGLVLNFEARGSGGPSYMLMETNGKNKKLISEFVKSNPANPAANSLMYSIYKMLPNDTDLTVFRENGNIDGFNFAFIGDHFDYHTVQDSYERIDHNTLQHQADYLMSGLNYFANNNISSFKSDEDYVYVNFPIIKLLIYPFNWVTPMWIAAIVILIVLIFFGISLNKLNTKMILKGFVPFLISLVLAVGVAFLSWKGILIIHPAFKDMLHGFTYNGYLYIAAIAAISIWIFFKVYKPYLKEEKAENFVVAPIIIWLVINGLILGSLKGAGFFIIPVLLALLILSIHIFMNVRLKSKALLYTLLSIPTIYIFSPMVKMFPVGLGLKILFVSALFIILILGLLIPVFSNLRSPKIITQLSGLASVILIVLATYNSGFNEEKRKPNSLVFVNNVDTNSSYFATYDNVLDDYTKQALGEDPEKGGLNSSNTQSKYGTRFKFHTKTENKSIKSADVIINKDTVIDDNRTLNIAIKPQRKTNKFELTTQDSLTIKSLGINGVSLEKISNKDYVKKIKRGTILSYFMGNSDSILNLEITLKGNVNPKIFINEISFDLLENPEFSLTPRTPEMMPTPFVTNDAIITTKKINLK